MSLTKRCALLASSIIFVSFIQGQNCFFTEDFSNGTVPAGWDIGQAVLLLGPQGDTLGGTTDAWRVGTAVDANEGGYFPVVNYPPANTFMMANDDAPPCNCNMDDVTLTSPSLDLSARIGTAMEFRIFHEGGFGVGNPMVQTSDNGGAWNSVETILPVIGVWQDVMIDLSAFDGSADLRFRIIWNDSLNWAGGVAVDDFCVYERNAADLSITHVFHAMVSETAFDPSERTIEYKQIPLTQVDTVIVGAEVKNNGTQSLSAIQVSVAVSDVLGSLGNFTLPVISSLAPGESARVFASTLYVPNESGPVQLMATANHSVNDDEPADNTLGASFDVTQPGPLYGHATMTSAGNSPEYVLSSDSTNKGFGILLETKGNGDYVYGIGVLLAQNTAPGTTLQGFLFDASLQVLDTSAKVLIDPSHISESANGNYMYLALAEPYMITQDQDLIAMVVPAAESGSFLGVSTSGTAPLGGSFEFDGSTSTWDFPMAIPMVRAYFSDPNAVMVEELNAQDIHGIKAFPNPTNKQISISCTNPTLLGSLWRLMSLDGKIVRSGVLSERMILDLTDLPSGVYAFVHGGKATGQSSLLISKQ